MRPLPSWLTVVAGLALGACTVVLLPADALFQSEAGHEHASASAPAGERWACPMMDFVGGKPGKCPVCGMTLVKVIAGEVQAESVRRLGLQTSLVTRGPAIATIHGYGAVRYDDRTARPVISRVAGRVVKRHPASLHPGEIVAVGDALIDLYSAEVYATQGELAAALKLGDQPTIAALSARFSRWNLSSVADTILAGGEPSDTVTITSPYAGRVLAGAEEDGGMAGKLPEVGEQIMSDRPLVRLIDPHAFMIVVHVPENRSRWIRVGQTARLATDDFGELPDLTAAVTWVAPELNLEIRAREIHLHLRDEKDRLLAGALVNARIQAALAPDLKPADPTDRATWGAFTLIPKTAVLSTGVRNVAWKISSRERDGRIRFDLAALALGPRLEDENGNDLYVVRAGLSPGDEVATQGAFLIDSQAQLAGTASLLYPLGANASAAVAPAHQH